MPVREQMTADMARHAADELTRSLKTHLMVMHAGGLSVHEAASAACTIAAEFAFRAIGCAVAFADDGGREEIADEAIEKVVAAIVSRRDEVVREVRRVAAGVAP